MSLTGTRKPVLERGTCRSHCGGSSYKWSFDMGSAGVVPSNLGACPHTSCNYLVIIGGVRDHVPRAWRCPLPSKDGSNVTLYGHLRAWGMSSYLMLISFLQNICHLRGWLKWITIEYKMELTPHIGCLRHGRLQTDQPWVMLGICMPAGSPLRQK